MRAFRFRLAPLQRLKRHAIEEKELELAALRRTEEELLAQVETGRLQLRARIDEFLEETGESHDAYKERDFDMFREYMMRLEQEGLASVATNRNEQERCRTDLVKLYQESKVLDRLEDRAREAHRKEEMREEGILLDELGGQSHERRRRMAGSVSQKVIFVIAFLSTIALFLVHERWSFTLLLEKAGVADLLRGTPSSVATTGPGSGASPGTPDESASQKPGVGEEYTTLEILNMEGGEVGQFATDVLNTRMELREELERIEREEARLTVEEERVRARMKEVLRLTEEQRLSIEKLRTADGVEREYRKARLEARLEDVSVVVGRMQQPRNAAKLLAYTWIDPNEVAKEIVLEVLRRMKGIRRARIMDAMAQIAPRIGAEIGIQLIENEAPSELALPTAETDGSPAS